jgi:hypothetical protein
MLNTGSLSLRPIPYSRIENVRTRDKQDDEIVTTFDEDKANVI